MTSNAGCMVEYLMSRSLKNIRRFASDCPLTLVVIFALMAHPSSSRSADPASNSGFPAELYFKTLGEPARLVTEYRLGQEGMLTRVTHLNELMEECTRKVTPHAW